jgi:hypothetical protein
MKDGQKVPYDYYPLQNHVEKREEVRKEIVEIEPSL